MSTRARLILIAVATLVGIVTAVRGPRLTAVAMIAVVVGQLLVLRAGRAR